MNHNSFWGSIAKINDDSSFPSLLVKLTKSLYVGAVFLLFIACKGTDLVASDPIILDNTNSKIKYADAGVYFIKREKKDSNYIKRAAILVPSIEIGRVGELYCAWYANKSTASGNGEGIAAYVTVSVSTDSGNTWMGNELIVAPIDTLDRIFDMSLWRDPGGDVHLFWSKSIKSVWDGKGSVWECTIKYDSLGGYITTSKPKIFMNSGVMLNKPILLNDKTTVLYSQYVINTQPSISWGTAGIYVYSGIYSQSAKALLQPLNSLKVPFFPSNLKSAFFEPQLLQIDNDTINCYIRTDNGGVYLSKATLKSNLSDWTPFSKLTQLGDNPSMRFCVRRLNSGNVLFVTCNHKDRVNMTAYLSTNNGTSFPYKVPIDPRWGVSYPDFTQNIDGTIYIAWDRGRTSPEREIVFVRLKEKDIINKSVVKLIKVSK